MKDKKSMYWKLFTSTFYLSSFTFGGGYVIVPLMKKKFVDDLKWIEEEEVLDLISIAQSSPGPIAVNAAIIMGYRVGGIKAAFISALGTILPPFIILSIISFFYAAFRDNIIINALLKGMQIGVAALIVNIIFNLSKGIIKEKNLLSIFIMVSSFIALYFYKVNIAIIIFICVFIAILSFYYNRFKEKRDN